MSAPAGVVRTSGGNSAGVTRGCALIVDDEPHVAELLRDALAA
jgi:hypothetical protein